MNKCLSRLGLSWVGHSRVGIKTRNAQLNSDHFEIFAAKQAVFSCTTDQLNFSVNHLHDRHTMLGTPIAESPHCQMMQLLQDGNTVAACNSEYVQRMRTGPLDPRGRTNVCIDELIVALEKCDQSMEEKSYRPIGLIKCDEQWFVADGERRAALCCNRLEKVNCVDITPVYLDRYYRRIYGRMCDRPELFKKHISFFQAFYEAFASGIVFNTY